MTKQRRCGFCFGGLLLLIITIITTFLGSTTTVIAYSFSSSSNSRNNNNNKLLIIGLGRVGLQVADLIATTNHDNNIQVFGTVRNLTSSSSSLSSRKNISSSSSTTLTEIQKIAFESGIVRRHLFGDDNNERKNDEAEVITPATHVLFTIPLKRNPDPVVETVLDDLEEWWTTTTTTTTSQQQRQTQTADNKYDNNKVLGILSTTGVYGDHNGDIVTEYSALLCDETSNAELYKKFEDYWIHNNNHEQENTKKIATTGDVNNNNNVDRHLCIFRCAGIYDSSRSALHTVYNNLLSKEEAEEGGIAPSTSTPIMTSVSTEKATINKTNRIHSVDLARAVILAMFNTNEHDNDKDNNDNDEISSNNGNNYSNSMTGTVKTTMTKIRIYNLSDDLPESRLVVLSYALKLLASIGISNANTITNTHSSNNDDDKKEGKRRKITTTNLTSSKSTTRQSRRLTESKIVSNRRMKEELLSPGSLQYPTYREGLYDIFNNPTTPWRQLQVTEEDDNDNLNNSTRTK